MAKTIKTMSAGEVFQKAIDGMKKARKKYKDSWEKSQQSPSKQKMKRKMDGGLNP